jgi:hypothetical protein
MKDDDYKIGDEVWWFKASAIGNHTAWGLVPGKVELVHDVITQIIDDDTIVCHFGIHKKNDIWGKTRPEAFSRLKEDLEKWGKLE